jgi:hypothetical protein
MVAPNVETAPIGTSSGQKDPPASADSRRFTGRLILISFASILAIGAVIFFLFSSDGSLDKSEVKQFQAPPSPSVPAPPVEVTINLTGLPKDAEVTLDGEPVLLPIQVNRTEKPALLKITARRYHPHIQAVSLSKSQDIAIEMKKRIFKRNKKKGASH